LKYCVGHLVKLILELKSIHPQPAVVQLSGTSLWQTAVSQFLL